MIGNGGGFSAGATGGSADAIVVSHTHTATSTVTDPGHTHLIQRDFPANVGIAPTVIAVAQGISQTGLLSAMTTSVTGITVATSNSTTGVSGTNANLPPYIVVYMWNRTA